MSDIRQDQDSQRRADYRGNADQGFDGPQDGQHINQLSDQERQRLANEERMGHVAGESWKHAYPVATHKR
jgi:hypothetical protein